MPDRMPVDMPEHMPEDMPDRMPEDMSDRMPEDLPVRKCINVMVRITRSKVILITPHLLQLYHINIISLLKNMSNQVCTIHQPFKKTFSSELKASDVSASPVIPRASSG
jgi:hypothetical protein